MLFEPGMVLLWEGRLRGLAELGSSSVCQPARERQISCNSTQGVFGMPNWPITMSPGKTLCLLDQASDSAWASTVHQITVWFDRSSSVASDSAGGVLQNSGHWCH